MDQPAILTTEPGASCSLRQETVEVYTNALGVGSETTRLAYNGIIERVDYVKDDFANPVRIYVQGADSGTNIWVDIGVAASMTVFPHAECAWPDGNTAYYTGFKGEEVPCPVAICNEKITVAVTHGGATTHGTFHILVRGAGFGEVPNG